MDTSKIKKIFRSVRIWLVIALVLVAVFSIPNLKTEGVQVSFVERGSPFTGQLQEGYRISKINSVAITDLSSYQNVIESIEPGAFVTIETDSGKFSSLYPEGAKTLGIHITKIPRHNIKLGLDLQGGTRVILSIVPINGSFAPLELIDTTRQVLEARLNGLGLKNVVIREVKDLSGETLLEIEMAGEGSESVVETVKSVGKFELKILNKTIFTGDAIVPPVGEPQQDFKTGQWNVPFTRSNDASAKLREGFLASMPEKIDACSKAEDCKAGFACSSGSLGGGTCLPRIEMYLDDQVGFSAPPAQSLYQSWKNGMDTKSLVVTSGAAKDANNVKVILEAGRLPNSVRRIDVVSQDYVDSKLGGNFIRGSIYAGIAALLAVSVVVYIKYRKLKIAIPILLTDFAEVIIVLGLSPLIGWSIDLPAIAGIIAIIGTGVDHQIIITDEILTGSKTNKDWSTKRRVKNAIAIIMAAATTSIAAMLPMLYPGFTGLYALRGFAFVTIIGIVIGVFVSRPVYAHVAEILLGEEHQ